LPLIAAPRAYEIAEKSIQKIVDHAYGTRFRSCLVSITGVSLIYLSTFNGLSLVTIPIQGICFHVLISRVDPIKYCQMEIQIATLGRRTTRKHAPAEELFDFYWKRIGHYCRCRAENYVTEEKFFAGVLSRAGRGTHFSRSGSDPLLILLDSRGRTFSTEQFAEWFQRQRDQSIQRLVFAVGPANGWSQEARERAGLLFSLGPMTLPHELAAVVLAEQIYRALTIIEGHPYHLGHAGE
jgi:23S rRNA (pseudouridine1915-N3)-methyltransferase